MDALVICHYLTAFVELLFLRYKMVFRDEGGGARTFLGRFRILLTGKDSIVRLAAMLVLISLLESICTHFLSLTGFGDRIVHK